MDFQTLLEIMQEPWAVRALIASLLVGITCGLLGVFIVLRNMSLIGDALSHAVLPGIFTAFLLVGYNTIGFFIGAVAAGLVSTLAMTWIQQTIKTRNDAAVGIVFTVMFSLGIIGISWLNAQQGAHIDLKDFLFGNVLTVSPEDLLLSAIVCLYTLSMVLIFYRYLFVTTFQPVIAQSMGISVKVIHYMLMFLLSFAVVSSLRTVGVILVVAMLITPASTALLWSNRLPKVLVISVCIGAFASIIGLILSILLDTTPGPLMVVVSGFIYLIAALLAPQKGILRKWLARKQQSVKILEEDMIKYLSKNNVNSIDNKKDMIKALGISEHQYSKQISNMKKSGKLTQNTERPQLSMKGKELGDQLVRAHRLWEAYQVDKLGMDAEQIHDEAERLEHVLTADILDEVDEKLGFPTKDPHGSPIPPKNHLFQNSIMLLNPRSKAFIAANQPDKEVESELWELGLFPDTHITVMDIGSDYIIIREGKREIQISAPLAQRILVKR